MTEPTPATPPAVPRWEPSEMMRKLAAWEDPYGNGPWDSKHIELQRGDAAKMVAEFDRLRAERDTAMANLRARRNAGQVAAEAAARIDAAYSHGVPSGPTAAATEADWDRVLRYARCGGSERVL